MKLKIILVAIGLGLITPSFIMAQDFKYGIQSGLVLTNIYSKSKPKNDVFDNWYNPMLSYCINGYVGYKGKSFFGISAEPGFIQKGGIVNYNQDTKDDDERLNYNYIQLPVLADFYLIKRLKISLGSEFSFLTNPDNIEKFEMSGLLGLSFDLNNKLDLGLRYSRGFTSTSSILLTDEFGNPTDDYYKEYNQYLAVFVRFKIN
jgi:hypothetical protein